MRSGRPALSNQEKREDLDASTSDNWRGTPHWGTSGVGKTSVAKQLGLRLSASWLHVDDVRLAFQRSRVTFPEKTEALYFFEETPSVWTLPPERLREGFIGVGQVLSPALEVIIENHVDTFAPIVIEGDAILPSLLSRPSVRDRMNKGHVQAVFLVENEEEVLFANIVTRSRGTGVRTDAELRTEARAKWLYGQWLVERILSASINGFHP